MISIELEKFYSELNINSKSVPKVISKEVKEYLMAQNYLLKVENNLIETPTEEDLEEQKCFNKYYSKILNNSNLNNFTNNFLSEKGYTVKELLQDKIKKNEDEKDINKEKLKIPYKKLQSELNRLEMDLDSLFSKYSDEIDLFKGDKYKFSDESYDSIVSKEDSKVMKLKEPNIKEGVPSSRFKYKSFKTENKI